jgi:hypothetical protein
MHSLVTECLRIPEHGRMFRALANTCDAIRDLIHMKFSSHIAAQPRSMRNTRTAGNRARRGHARFDGFNPVD